MTALTRRVVGVSAAMVAVILLASLSLTAIAQAQTTPTITSITVSDITMTSATVTVNLADAPDETTVYLKYGPLNALPPDQSQAGRLQPLWRSAESEPSLPELTKIAPDFGMKTPSVAPPCSICRRHTPSVSDSTI